MALFPIKFGFSDMTIEFYQPVVVSEARSLKRLTRRIPADRWQVQLKTRPYSHAERRELRSFLMRHGSFTPFTIILPVEADTLGDVDSVTVAANAAKGDDTATLFLDGDFALGDWVQFANHEKIYSVLSQDGDVIEFWPPLKVAVEYGETVKIKNIEMAVLATDDTVKSVLTTNGGTDQTNIDLVEVV